MANLFLISVEIVILGLGVLGLHHLNRKYGYLPFLMLIGVITVLLQSQAPITIKPAPDMFMIISSTLFIPLLVMSVLLLYIADGTIPARIAIVTIIGMSLFTILGQYSQQLHVSLPDSVILNPNLSESAFRPSSPRLIFASLLTLTLNLLLINVFYQAIKNRLHALPQAVTITAALLISLWLDALLFRAILDFGQPDFVQWLSGDLFGKTWAGVLLAVPMSVYLTRIASRWPEYQGDKHRPALDVLLGTLQHTQEQLMQTEAALQRAQTERQNESENFRQLVENTNEAFWLVDPNTQQVSYVNPAYERIWGRSASEFYSIPNLFLQTVHPDDLAYVIEMLTLQGKITYEIEFRIVRPDGTIRYIRDRAFATRDQQGEIKQIIGLAEDITEQKLSEIRNLELNLERQKVELLRAFINDASHDLKNPLTAINLKVQRLLRASDALQRQQFAYEIHGLVAQMSNMIDELLILARLESVSRINRQPLNLNDLMQETIGLLRAQIEEKTLILKTDLTTQLMMIQGERDDLRRALANVLHNAFRYTPSHGTITIQTICNTSEGLIVISDTGVGIPLGDQERIFERFFRAGNVQEQEGTGLGLAIVQKIVERHQGRIEFESVEGRGTTFKIYLPLYAQVLQQEE
ncbi:MAG: PAS domain-containing sensor histidine kinase [Anaerolineae bacterium]|nr:PAS domain-containing sensor histidine kinase [Anaerolineae bacterium]